MDRLSEFQSLTNTLSATPSSSLPTPPLPPTPNPPPITSLKSFHESAASVSLGIANVSKRLHTLSSMVRKKSMFNDKTTEINNLVVSIKSDIEILNTDLERCQVLMNETKKHRSIGGKTSQASSHTSTIFQTLKSSILDKTTSFKNVLQERTEGLREVDEKKKGFGSGSAGVNRLAMGKSQLYDEDSAKNYALKMGTPVKLTKPPPAATKGSTLAPTTFRETAGMHHRSPPSTSTSTSTSTSNSNSNSNSYYSSSNPIAMPTYSNSQYNSELSSLSHLNDNTGSSLSSLTPYEIEQNELEGGGSSQSQLLLPNGNEYYNERATAMGQIEVRESCHRGRALSHPNRYVLICHSRPFLLVAESHCRAGRNI